MRELLETPVFQVLVSILAYETGLFIYRKTRISIFNPLLIGILLVMGFIMKFGISLDTYNKGGNLISFFLGPATVILAVPLYKQLDSLKKEFIPIMAGVLTGCITTVFSVHFLSQRMGLSKELQESLIPKSITTPIGIELSKQLGGIPSVTVAAILITGILGAMIGPGVCKLLRITDKTATGIAIGTSSHAVGTTKAVELGEKEGAMSGLAIGVAGLFTVLLVSVFGRFL